MDNNDWMQQQMMQINLQNQMIQNSINQQRRNIELEEEMRLLNQQNRKKKKKKR